MRAVPLDYTEARQSIYQTSVLLQKTRIGSAVLLTTLLRTSARFFVMLAIIRDVGGRASRTQRRAHERGSFVSYDD